MEKKYCYDNFSENYYNYIREFGRCAGCKEVGMMTKFINRHGRMIAKCSIATCGCEIWAGCYREAYEKYLNSFNLPELKHIDEKNDNESA